MPTTFRLQVKPVLILPRAIGLLRGGLNVRHPASPATAGLSAGNSIQTIDTTVLKDVMRRRTCK